MEDKICCIYSIECLANGKRYIGQSTNYISRMRGHRSELRRNAHENDCLQKAWNKYGEDNFIFSIVEECKAEELDDLEKYYISKYNSLSHENGYNIEGGGNSNKHVPQRTKDLISKHHADVSGVNNPMYGVKMKDDSISKTVNNINYINRKHKGEDSHMCTITENAAREIKKYFSDGHKIYRGEIRDIADKYNTSSMIVSHIKNGHAWTWLSI